jgi:hypothetical protein
MLDTDFALHKPQNQSNSVLLQTHMNVLEYVRPYIDIRFRTDIDGYLTYTPTLRLFFGLNKCKLSKNLHHFAPKHHILPLSVLTISYVLSYWNAMFSLDNSEMLDGD